MVKALVGAGFLGCVLLGIPWLVSSFLALGLVGAILRLLVRGPVAC